MLNFINFYYRTTIIDYVFGLFLVRLYLLKKNAFSKNFFFIIMEKFMRNNMLLKIFYVDYEKNRKKTVFFKSKFDEF